MSGLTQTEFDFWQSLSTFSFPPHRKAQMELRETIPSKEEIVAFGKNVVKIIDAEGKTVCFIGEQQQKEMMLFPAPISFEFMPSLHEIWEKRKVLKDFLETKRKRA